MREKTPKTALFLLSVALLAPAASAHPSKPAPRKPVHAAQPARVSAHARSKQPASVDLRRNVKASARTEESRGSKHKLVERDIPEHTSAPHLVADRHGRHDARNKHEEREERADTRKPAGRHAASLRDEARSVEQSRPSGRHHAAPIEEARVETHTAPRPQPHQEPAPDQPAPEAATLALPPIEVHHNRKIHLAADAAPASPDAATPRKATVEDFLDTPAAPVDNATPTPSPSSAPALKRPISLPVAPPIPERKLPAIPVAKPIPVILPDPVIEPVLYTARGHLIVPPAMKGSHEILLHQNEMANLDGLIRVQDDEDLERLRTSRQLVALPVSDALEVDERLPVNRRYCRPWTAQFLAALARAHYAHFHTPLQVNSAVRTVEFQERLRYTNGNAAPADGETASPHLTGQAIDLAKHGLSMTEIAWMRGYLMPLVQQGKVDVEEEFQQSCFHISVYKKYMPQPAPKRDIPQHRGPATALAAAIQ